MKPRLRILGQDYTQTLFDELLIILEISLNVSQIYTFYM